MRGDGVRSLNFGQRALSYLLEYNKAYKSNSTFGKTFEQETKKKATPKRGVSLLPEYK